MFLRLGGLLLALLFATQLWAATPESLIYFTSLQNWREAIFAVSPDGKHTRLLLPNEIHPPFNCFLAGGNRRGNAVVYSADTAHGTQVFIVKPDGGGKKQLTTEGNNYSSAVSPDGKLVLFHSLRDGHCEIYRVNADGSGETRLTKRENTRDHCRDATFSPDGTRILFTSYRAGVWNIYTMKLDGSDEICLSKDAFHGTEAAYSADGKFIVFINEKSQVSVMNSDGTGLFTLTEDQRPASRPTFSPDGQTIVYQSGPLYESELMVINIDGNNQHLLLPNGMKGWSPWWAAGK